MAKYGGKAKETRKWLDKDVSGAERTYRNGQDYLKALKVRAERLKKKVVGKKQKDELDKKLKEIAAAERDFRNIYKALKNALPDIYKAIDTIQELQDKIDAETDKAKKKELLKQEQKLIKEFNRKFQPYAERKRQLDEFFDRLAPIQEKLDEIANGINIA